MHNNNFLLEEIQDKKIVGLSMKMLIEFLLRDNFQIKITMLLLIRNQNKYKNNRKNKLTHFWKINKIYDKKDNNNRNNIENYYNSKCNSKNVVSNLKNKNISNKFNKNLITILLQFQVFNLLTIRISQTLIMRMLSKKEEILMLNIILLKSLQVKLDKAIYNIWNSNSKI